MTYTKKDVAKSVGKASAIGFIFGLGVYITEATGGMSTPFGFVGGDSARINGENLHANGMVDGAIAMAATVIADGLRMALAAAGEAAAPHVENGWKKTKTAFSSCAGKFGRKGTREEVIPIATGAPASQATEPAKDTAPTMNV